MIMLAEDSYDVAGSVVEIPLSQIREAADNVRSDLGDLEGLADSIREVGVLQPVLVLRDPSGDTFELLAGARRTAACQVVGLMTIPAIVRERPDDAKRQIAMLIENVQRRDLSPIDEATAFDRLVHTFDLEQDDLARRVGCSQSHVSKRLSLLQLPARARDMVAAHELTIGDAVELARLADDPDRIDTILDEHARFDGDIDIDNYVESELRERDHAAKVNALEEKLKERGVEIIGSAMHHKFPTVGGDGYSSAGKLELDARKHAKEPCHAARIDGAQSTFQTPKIQYVCTTPSRHTGKGPSDLKVPKGAPTTSGKSKSQVEQERAERDAAKARRAFMADLLANGELDEDRVVELIKARYLRDAAHQERQKMCELLGLEKPSKGNGGSLPDYGGQIDRYVAGGADNELRACLAFALVQGEWTMAGWFGDEHARLLEELGYTPPTAEKPAKGKKAKQPAAPVERVDDTTARDAAQRIADVYGDDELVRSLLDELDCGTSPARVAEISNILDARFVELHDLQPGDVVANDTGEESAHRIERVEADDEGEVNAPPAPGTGPPSADEQTSTGPLESPPEGVAAPPSSDPRPPFVKLPKDCTDAELKARGLVTFIDAIDQNIDRPDRYQGFVDELVAGVDADRAVELHELLEVMYSELRDELEVRALSDELLSDYLGPAKSGSERRCRAIIAELDPDDERVQALQQVLYRGISIDDATEIRTQLKAIGDEA